MRVCFTSAPLFGRRTERPSRSQGLDNPWLVQGARSSLKLLDMVLSNRVGRVLVGSFIAVALLGCGEGVGSDDAAGSSSEGGQEELDSGADKTCGMSPAELSVFEEVNRRRDGEGVSALRCDTVLVRAARAHSQDMCDQDYFSHTGKDGSNFAQRVRRVDAGYQGAGGENIALGQQTPEAVMKAWMESQGHRENILRGSYGRLGVGQVGCNGRPLWTQVFWQ